MRGALIFGVFLAAHTPAAAQQNVYGTGQAKDGDSLTVGGTEVRLFGIDAPEWDQTCKRNGQDWSCGADAADKLAQLVTGKNVVCSSMGIRWLKFARSMESAVHCASGG